MPRPAPLTQFPSTRTHVSCAKTPTIELVNYFIDSAFAKVTVHKGVKCLLSLYKQSTTCESHKRMYTGSPNSCTTFNGGPKLTCGSFDCEVIPLPTEWPPADITIYSSDNCGQDPELRGQGLELRELDRGLPTQHKYPAVEANKCIKADVTLGDANFLGEPDRKIRSSDAEVVADTEIPIPPGFKCQLVLFQRADCRTTSVPSNGHGDPGVCVKPLALRDYPIEALMWRCGYA
jgi:hypothetical protein